MDNMESFGIDILTSLLSSALYEKINDQKVKRCFEQILIEVEKNMATIDSCHKDYIQGKVLEYFYFYIKSDGVLNIELPYDFIGNCENNAPFYMLNDERKKLAKCIDIINSGIVSLMSFDHQIFQREFVNIREDLNKIMMMLKPLVDTNKKSQNKNDAKSNWQITDEIENNRKKEFLEIWKEILFLNRGEKDNENLTLENLYVVPDYYRWRYSGEKKERLKSEQPLEELLSDFINNDHKKGLIIYGGPGIGKSSLVNYIAGKEENFNKYKKKFIYIDAQGLEIEEMKKEALSDSILKFLGCTKKNFENSICILDGFDEIQSGTHLDDILSKFMQNIVKLKVKVIITCRDNAIDCSNLGERVSVIELKTFDEERIRTFSNKYKEYRNVQFDINEMGKNKEYNEEVLGIPLMLYFVHALDLKMSDAVDKCKLYNKVFSGIYDKCRIEYLDSRDQIKRDSNWGMPVISEISEKMKKDFDRIAQMIAFEIFKQDKEWQNKQEIEKILKENENIKEKMSIERYPISNFYQISRGNIKFAHRSFYEYFMSEYIYRTILENLSDNSKMADNLIEIICRNYINNEIKSFLEYKINNGKENLGRNSIYAEIENITENILIRCEESYKSEEKARIFFNMLAIFQMFHTINGVGNYKEIYQKNPDLFRILLTNFQLYRGNECGRLDLQYINFRGGNLEYINFIYADLSNCLFDRSSLLHARLEKCLIFKTQFVKSDLSHTSFRDSIVYRVVFNLCEFYFTDFLRTSISESKLKKGDFQKCISILVDSGNYKDIDIDLKNSFIFNSDNHGEIQPYFDFRDEIDDKNDRE